MLSEEAIAGALSVVRDPELDESITNLGFVQRIEIAGDMVDVHLRLPTYFCAPNFAYIMVADARAALLAMPEVRHARVALMDHFCADDINAEAAGDSPALRGSGVEELAGLRETFRRKAFLSRQATLCAELLSQDFSPQGLAQLKLGDIPDSHAKDQYVKRRMELGLDVGASALLLVDPGGSAIPEQAVDKHLRFARLTSLNTEANATICRAVLASRYADATHAGQE